MKNMGIFQKSENWWLRLIIVLITITSLSLLTTANKESLIEFNLLQQKNDSLSSEIFILNTQVSRYEITLDMLKEVDSIAAQKFEKILYTETE